jgi:cation transport regulator ChaC
MMIYYFAYGHNTNTAEFQRRIPKATMMGTAVLPGYRFILHHFSNIVPSEGAHCTGVLWRIPNNSLKILDRDEAYHVNYDRLWVDVLTHHGKRHAVAYVMTPTYLNMQMPSAKYVRWVEQGYVEHGISLKQLIRGIEYRLELNDRMNSTSKR